MKVQPGLMANPAGHLNNAQVLNFPGHHSELRDHLIFDFVTYLSTGKTPLYEVSKSWVSGSSISTRSSDGQENKPDITYREMKFQTILNTISATRCSVPLWTEAGHSMPFQPCRIWSIPSNPSEPKCRLRLLPSSCSRYSNAAGSAGQR